MAFDKEKLDNIGGWPPYKLSIPISSRYGKLRAFLGVTDEWLALYEILSAEGGACVAYSDYLPDVFRRIGYTVVEDRHGEISTNIWHLAIGGTWIFHVEPQPNSIAMALICAELFDRIEWIRAVNQVYFVGRGYHGMPDALYYVLRLSNRMLLPPESLRAAPMALFADMSRGDPCEEWLQRHPEVQQLLLKK